MEQVEGDPPLPGGLTLHLLPAVLGLPPQLLMEHEAAEPVGDRLEQPLLLPQERPVVDLGHLLEVDHRDLADRWHPAR